MKPRSPDVQRQAQLAKWIGTGNAQRWRETAGHARASVARELGVTERTLFRWEKKLSRPDSANWFRYWQYLNSIHPNHEEEPCPPPRNRSSGAPTPAGSPDVQPRS